MTAQIWKKKEKHFFFSWPNKQWVQKHTTVSLTFVLNKYAISRNVFLWKAQTSQQVLAKAVSYLVNTKAMKNNFQPEINLFEALSKSCNKNNLVTDLIYDTGMLNPGCLLIYMVLCGSVDVCGSLHVLKAFCSKWEERQPTAIHFSLKVLCNKLFSKIRMCVWLCMCTYIRVLEYVYGQIDKCMFVRLTTKETSPCSVCFC